jgi:hypothetical protein
MPEQEFEYDVAFSFAAQDEGIATQLNDLLSDRMKTFIYPEHQKKLAGTDGMISFSDVYGRKARTVVVLFRTEWGNTPWTKVESEAIRARAHEEGFDFTLFIVIEAKPTLPAWLPRTRLYLALERFGLEAAAAVVETRVTEAGGSPHEETILERAQRNKRANELLAAQKQFWNSGTGVQAANQAFEKFTLSLEQGCKEIKQLGTFIELHNRYGVRVVQCGGLNLIISWRLRFNNSLDESVLDAEFYQGFPRLPGFIPTFEEARRIHTEQFDYKLMRMDHHTYVRRGNKREFGPDKLADHLLKKLMDLAEKYGRT